MTVKRYSLNWEWMAEDPKGEYVKYEDYETLQKLLAAAISEVRQHRWCGDTYPVNGWSSANTVLAKYAAHRRQS